MTCTYLPLLMASVADKSYLLARSDIDGDITATGFPKQQSVARIMEPAQS